MLSSSFCMKDMGRGFAKSAPQRHFHQVIQFIEPDLFHRWALEQVLMDVF